LRDADALAHRGALGADAAQRQIGLGTARALEAIDHEIKLGGRERLAVGGAGDARPFLDQAHLVAREHAVDLGLGSAAQDHRHVGRTRAGDGVLKTVGHGQEREQHHDDQRDRDDGREREPQPLAQALQIHHGDGGDLQQQRRHGSAPAEG
jgi:hypothetical protein